ncbi:MAG: FkbM family methyltransferase [Thermoanaerobaculia bacterium]
MFRRFKGRGTTDTPLTRQSVVWAYRVLLEREPESEQIISDWLNTGRSLDALRREVIASAEFRTKNPAAFSYAFQRSIVMKELDEGPRLFLDLSDVYIGLAILQGNYERVEVSLLKTFVHEGDVVVDVGANIGFYTVLLAELVGPSGHVFAYEPLPQNTALLEKSISENRFDDRVKLRKAVLSDRPGTAELVWLPLERGSQCSGGSYIRAPGAPVPPGHDVLSVSMATLDAEEFPGPVRFLKIDVEGAEPLVFRGARETLRRDRPVILAEINPTQLGTVSGMTPDAFLREMEGWGYACFRFQDGSVTRRLSTLQGSEIRTVVFLPAETR